MDFSDSQGNGRGLLLAHPKVQQSLTVAALHQVTTVLLGETGVGKEYVADLIQRAGKRRAMPFIKFSCVGFADDVIDSELFGHVRGAFTGAIENRVGLLESAHGGTLLIDEIGDMSLKVQAKLLRFLQDGEIRPVGSSKTKHVDCRSILATRRDLSAMVQAGTFRDDLYYRISDLTITLPPLRSRRCEIAGLSDRFMVRAAKDFSKTLSVLSDVDRGVMAQLPWSGNIRELQSYCRRLVLLSQ